MTKPVTGQGIIDWYKGLDPDTQGDLTNYYDEIIYDNFKNDDIYKTVFAQGNWGKIEDATLETFGEVKTYINDTIFATEHQTVYDDDEYVPSVDRSIDGGPKYMDVSEYMDGTKGNIDRTLPTVYARPADPVLPQQLIMRYSSTAHLARPEHGGIDRWYGRPEGYSAQKAQERMTPPGNIDTLGDYQRHLDQVKANRIEAGKADFSRVLKEGEERAAKIWEERTSLEGWRWQDDYEINKIHYGRFEDQKNRDGGGEKDSAFDGDWVRENIKPIIGSDKKEDIQAWMAMASLNKLEKDETGKLDRIQFVYDYYGGVLPTTQEEFQTRGDPLVEWQKDKGKSWREQNA
tara:strand:+ start:213 stop:1250 length:1038 start_codon:yes stop_codon:yes gene_type:complete